MQPWSPATREYRKYHLDSTRWDGYRPRPNDIVITTPYKSGTTWMQRIVGSLVLWPDPLTTQVGELSPWIDARFHGPIGPILEKFDAQQRRLLGKKMTAIGTLVERSSRFVMLIRLEGIKSNIVVPALREHVLTLPEQLRRSVTWDQGKEMALHAQFTIDTGIQIYFCDPKSPWQRGTNENTNGLLRQYVPRRTDLAGYTQADLDAVAAELNGRPRKTLAFMTPSEKFAQAVAATR